VGVFFSEHSVYASSWFRVHYAYVTRLVHVISSVLPIQGHVKRRTWSHPTSTAMKLVKWFNAIALHKKLISELRSVTRRMLSHCVICHPRGIEGW